ncbi:MAG: LysM peptidoglycan-binding domain-containing protein [Sporolactobacillus sp.]|jgi:LysM repeat protein|nr:LysM peptidoglycan-binding domain-containing protein [Sporolactobacillus sp.]
MKKSFLSAALISSLVVAGSGATGLAHQAKAASNSDAANLAQQGVGQRYVWGANDCSGFTMKVFAKLGVSLPHSSAAQAGYGVPVAQADLQPGDLVFFNTSGQGISHVGIYVGGGRMISAENERTGVRETQIFGTGGASSYWSKRYVTARRVISGSTQTTVKPAAQQATVRASAVAKTVKQQPASQTSKTADTSTSATAKTTTPTPTKTTSTNAATYKVQKGDTLSDISTKVNVSVATLKSINGLSSERIDEGQVLKLKGQPKTVHKTTTAKSADRETAATASTENAQPTSSAKQTASAQPQAAATATSHKAKGGTYVVSTGDSLWVISRDNGISVAQIRSYNKLKSDTIYPGQKLLVSKPIAKTDEEAANYTIKKGDTLWDIARTRHTTVSGLMKANKLNSSLIFPNQELNIPEK